MIEGSNQQGEKFKPVAGTWVRMVLVGICCAVVFPIVPALFVSISCGYSLLCFLVDHSLWVAGISAAIGFIGGMFVTFKMAQHAHRKRFEDQPLQPAMTIERRKGDAWIGYLNQYGRDRHGRH